MLSPVSPHEYQLLPCIWFATPVNNHLQIWCRCSIQLTILGYVLVPIFAYDRWWLVLIYAGFMITIAAAEAVSRPLGSYQVSSIFSFSHQHLMVISIATPLLASEQDNDTPVVQKNPTLQGSISESYSAVLTSASGKHAMLCTMSFGATLSESNDSPPLQTYGSADARVCSSIVMAFNCHKIVTAYVSKHAYVYTARMILDLRHISCSLFPVCLP